MNKKLKFRIYGILAKIVGGTKPTPILRSNAAECLEQMRISKSNSIITFEDSFETSTDDCFGLHELELAQKLGKEIIRKRAFKKVVTVDKIQPNVEIHSYRIMVVRP